MNLFSVIAVAILFTIVMVVFSTETLDYLTVAIFSALLAAGILYYTTDGTVNFTSFIGMIEFKPLLFIFGIQIVIAVSERQKIFQYVAIQTIRLTKGNDRTLFYVICIISTLLAAVVADVTVAIIFAPLIIRTCRILEIKPAPYLFGMTICINIGSMITPFSSSENIIIAGHFEEYAVNTIWFVKNVMVFGFIVLIVTMLLLDMLLLKKNVRVDPIRKELVRDILVPSAVIVDKKKFIMNSIFLTIVFISFFVFTDAYLVALVGSILMILLNRQKLVDYFKKVEWEVMFFFASLYIIIGCMIENGTIEVLTDFLNKILPSNPLVVSIFIVLLSSLLSGFLANSPTTLMFLAIIDQLIIFNPSLSLNPNVLIIALLVGINMGGNFLPQGAACDVMTLTIATRNNVEGFSFKTLTKNGALFALIHIICGVVYITFYYFIF
ncbi:MAG: anion permease [Candidatus Lokiarchaeota archaeon]|nr:anion permease [Candidatus Lokiarchaeota archaeon]